MKRVLRIVLIALVVGAGAPVAGSGDADARFRVGNWTGAAYTSRGRFSHCRIWVAYKSGITLHFLQFRSYNLYVGMSRPTWDMNPAGRYAMTLIVDGRVIRTARGVVLHGDTTRLWLPLGRDYYVRERLRRGYLLTLTNGSQRYRFRLTATSAALARLERCLRYRG